MNNPFRLRWLHGWTFQIVLMEGHVNVEAQGFGICLRTTLNPGESPRIAADRLVLAEDNRRKNIHKAWLKANLKDKNLIDNFNQISYKNSNQPSSLVVVQ